MFLYDIFLKFISVKPNERPQVFGFKPRYRVGDTLSMTCYVNNTFPAANLTWYINGKRVKMPKIHYTDLKLFSIFNIY